MNPVEHRCILVAYDISLKQPIYTCLEHSNLQLYVLQAVLFDVRQL